MNKKIAIIYGTRPEYLKLKTIINLIPKKKIEVIFTGQHDQLISKNFYTKKISINKKKNNRLNNIFYEIFKKINLNNYSSVIIQGDTATACAAAISAFNNKKKIIYIESGLRSFDKENPYPEEAYRVLISKLADINFAPTNLSKKNLNNERVTGKIYVVGNTGLDNLVNFRKKTLYTNQILITIHRRENLPILDRWIKALNLLAKKYHDLEFIYPIHANPEIKKKISKIKNIKIIEALNHDNMIKYLVRSRLIISDSGGIQEEASFFNKKVIVCRKITERPEGIDSNHLYLCKKPEFLPKLFERINKNYKINVPCPYGDGKSSKRIIKILRNEGFI
jgi:UDP-N-acetylglucosamine 2-epimerase (non-hydrolysing)